jgi:hypothetical protein
LTIVLRVALVLNAALLAIELATGIPIYLSLAAIAICLTALLLLRE